MKDLIAVTGIVFTEPRQVVTDDGLVVVSFRLASTLHDQDPGSNYFEDPTINWYTVTAFRQLAVNVFDSVHKGDRVVVTGGLRIRTGATPDATGTEVEIEGAVIGHDLNWGNSRWQFTNVNSVAVDKAHPETSESSGADEGFVDSGEPHEGDLFRAGMGI